VAPLRTLLASDRPYAGGLIPQATNAMTELRKQLEQRLQQAKAKALQEISEQEARLKADAVFQKLVPEQQVEVLAPTAAAKSDVRSSNKPGTALLRLNRYRSDEVPKQLQRMAALAAPKDAPPPAEITVVAASALKVSCSLSQITNEAELGQWLEALGTAVRKELDQGHRISL
jgi:hypothetical protein